MLNEEKIIQSNWVIRIVAFLCACILWLYVMNDQNPIVEQSFDVPIQRVNLDNNMSVDNLPKKVKVTISAPRIELFNADVEVIQAYVDLKSLKEGRQRVGVFAKTDLGKITKVEPYSVFVNADKIIEKEFKASAKIVGIPSRGVVAGKMELIPSSFKIRGSSKDIERVDKVLVSVDVSSQIKSFDYEARPIPLGYDGTEIYDLEVIPNKVKVQVEMIKQITTKSFVVKPMIQGPFAKGHTISDVQVEPNVVKISAASEVLDNIIDIKTSNIDLAGVKDDIQLEVPLNLPENVFSDVHSVKVKIKFKKN